MHINDDQMDYNNFYSGREDNDDQVINHQNFVEFSNLSISPSSIPQTYQQNTQQQNNYNSSPRSTFDDNNSNEQPLEHWPSGQLGAREFLGNHQDPFPRTFSSPTFPFNPATVPLGQQGRSNSIGSIQTEHVKREQNNHPIQFYQHQQQVMQSHYSPQHQLKTTSQPQSLSSDQQSQSESESDQQEPPPPPQQQQIHSPQMVHHDNNIFSVEGYNYNIHNYHHHQQRLAMPDPLSSIQPQQRVQEEPEMQNHFSSNLFGVHHQEMMNNQYTNNNRHHTFIKEEPIGSIENQQSTPHIHIKKNVPLSEEKMDAEIAQQSIEATRKQKERRQNINLQFDLLRRIIAENSNTFQVSARPKHKWTKLMTLENAIAYISELEKTLNNLETDINQLETVINSRREQLNLPSPVIGAHSTHNQNNNSHNSQNNDNNNNHNHNHNNNNNNNLSGGNNRNNNNNLHHHHHQNSNSYPNSPVIHRSHHHQNQQQHHHQFEMMMDIKTETGINNNNNNNNMGTQHDFSVPNFVDSSELFGVTLPS